MTFRSLGSLILAGLVLGSASLAATAADPAPGEAVFNQKCANCHNGGISGFMMGAPKTGSAAMQARLKQAGSIEVLTTRTAKGYGKMPAQGGPQGRPEAELRAAIEWMLKPAK